MPARDIYHDPVRNALEKDDWTITDDPFTMEFDETNVFADLAAEKLLSAWKANHRIVVEVKVFSGPSRVAELEQALGQYGRYRSLLKRVAPDRDLFMAIAHDVYEDFFEREAVQAVLEDHSVRLLVFDPDQEEIVKWIS